MAYFIIRCTEDGTKIEQLEEGALLERITPDEDGETWYGSDLEFLSAVPQSDKGYWYGVGDNAAIIIKGEIIVPKAKAVATKYEL